MFLVMFPGVAKLRNICFGRKICVREAENVFDSRQKHFLFSEKQNLFPQHMFPARLNWETFCIRINVCATRLFQASRRTCLNCVHNCDDHTLLDFKSAVQYMKHLIYHFTMFPSLARPLRKTMYANSY